MTKKMTHVYLKSGTMLEFEKVEFIHQDNIGVVGLQCYHKWYDRDFQVYAPIASVDYVLYVEVENAEKNNEPS